MRARVLNEAGAEVVPELTVLIVEKDPAKSTAMFRHICLKTHDPRIRYQEALKVLAASYYMRPRNFSGTLTATASTDSTFAADVLEVGRCELRFAQYNQSYRLPCRVSELASEDPVWQATYWHNRMFNPELPPDVRVLAFEPLWRFGDAEPPP